MSRKDVNIFSCWPENEHGQKDDMPLFSFVIKPPVKLFLRSFT